MSFKDKYVELLNMQRIGGDGGYLVETYRAKDQRLEIDVDKTIMVQQTKSDDTRKDGTARHRNLYTTIYYLMDKASAPRVNKSDNIHFYHDGSPVKYYWLDMKNKILEQAILGSNIAKGQCFQLIVPRGMLKWAEVLDDGIHDRCALLSECVTPGFELEDMTMPSREELQTMFPEFWEDIKKGFS